MGKFIGVLIGLIVGIPLASGIMLATAALEAFVIQELWKWYVVAALDIPAPHLAVCFGLGLLFTFMGPPPPVDYAQTEDKKLPGKRLLAYILYRPLAALFMGWLAHFFL